MVLGIAIFFFALFKVGVPFLVNLSFFVSGNQNDSMSNSNKTTFVAPPYLNSTYDATNSATLKNVSGNALKDHTVNLYVNDEMIDKASVRDDGTFIFENIKLKSGENTIKTKAIRKDEKESNFSNILTIAYKNSAPKLTIDTPGDNQSFSNKDENPIKVAGKTDSGVKVTVNDFWAVVDSDGNYLYQLKLQNGDNKIMIIATDPAGNTSKTERTVKYSQ